MAHAFSLNGIYKGHAKAGIVVIKIFSQGSPHPSFLYKYVLTANMLSDQIASADYLLLPFAYEYIFDYADHELAKKGITAAELVEMKEMAKKYDSLSVQYGLPLIVTFYRDPAGLLPLQNAIVFRTSIYASKAAEHEYGMPAFLEELSDDPGFTPREKPVLPQVSFRGNMAPLILRPSIKLRLLYNSLIGAFHPKLRVHTFLVNGYLVRRAAVHSLQNRSDAIKLDIAINPNPQRPDYYASYLRQFLQNDYFLCVAGHGNYSYRLFEVMRSGRIPVFINTDCSLPCKELVDWKNLVIWIEEKDVSSTAQCILDFHATIHPDDFLALQHKIRQVWESYFTMEGFSAYLMHHFLPHFKRENALSL